MDGVASDLHLVLVERDTFYLIDDDGAILIGVALCLAIAVCIDLGKQVAIVVISVFGGITLVCLLFSIDGNGEFACRLNESIVVVSC